MTLPTTANQGSPHRDAPRGRLRLVAVVSDPATAATLGEQLPHDRFAAEVIVGDAHQASAAIASRQPDLILAHIDVIGTGKGSVMATHRRQETYLPVVVMGPRDQAAALAQALAEGAVASLYDPPEPAQLARALGRAADLATMFARARAQSEARRHLEAERQAAERELDAILDSLYMAWQPAWRADSLDLYGFEALVRSRAGGGTTAPRILDLSGRLDRMQQLQRRILQVTAEDLARHAPPGAIFVNIEQPQLVDGVLGSSDDPLLPFADRVLLEVDGDTPLRDIDRISEGTARLRAAGYRVAVTDLGSGRDQLAHILALQPDVFKLDRSTWAGSATDPRRARVVRSTIQLARDQGASVVGQGVEQEAEADLLTAMGCDLLQGFLLGAPSPRDHWTAERLARPPLPPPRRLRHPDPT